MTRSTISKSFMSVLGTVVKVTLWSFMALALLVAGSLVMVVNVLSSERLTPIVEHFASKSVNADVHLGKATLDFRSSAPFLMLTLEDLYVVSRDMRELPDSLRNMIPAQADTLFSLKKFSGGINLIHLAKGKINMCQVVFDSPSVFIADVAPGITNYDIIKDSPEKEQSDTTDMYVPEIEFDSFRIINPGPVRYHNFQTGDSALLNIAAISLKGNEAPLYHMEIVTSMESGLFDRYNIKDMVFALDGGIRWSKSAPAIIDLVDLNLRVAFLDIKADTRINFENGPVIEKMEAAVSSLKLKDIVAIIPTEVRHDAGIDRLSTDARIDMDIVLDAPYDPVSDTLPAATVKMSVAPCRIDIGKLHIGTFYTDIIFKNVDNDMDNATLFIDRFFMRGDRRGLDISASGTVTRLLSDPLFDGKVTGNIHLSYLPEALTDKLGGHLSGDVAIDSDMRLRPSYFNRASFHKLLFKGSVDAHNINFISADSMRKAYVRHALFELGTSKKFVRDTISSPNMLTASFIIDSASVIDPDAVFTFTDMHAGVGSVNERESADSGRINPMGASFKLKKLDLVLPADSSRLYLADVSAVAVLKRYLDNESIPEFIVSLDARRLRAGDRTNRFMLSQAKIDLNAHLNPRMLKFRRLQQKRIDSISRAYPGLDADSVVAMANARYIRKTDNSDSEAVEWIDKDVARPVARFLRNWVIDGNINARRASLFTPVFPLRNQIRNFKIGFTSDSVSLSKIRYVAGRSDFEISGSLSNIRRALSGNSRSPLRINLHMQSDTIDVNQLAAAFFAGAAYSAKKDSLDLTLSDTDNDEELQSQIENLHSGLESTGPLLIPMNVDANLTVKTDNIIYSDLLLHNMSGGVQVFRGAVNLNNLSASSDVGSIDISALYAAPDTSSMNFGFGMQTRGFNIERFLQLVPAVDSILPLLGDMGGIINADMAATCDIQPNMDIDIPSLRAALKIHGDSLTLLDPETFKTVSKWLFFKNKNRNLIDSMSVEILVEDSQLKVFPFSFNFDRYKLGVLGNNDFNMNYNYHIAVLKSPIPFKFGVNITGTPDNMKIRLGGSKFKKGMDVRSVSVVDTTRVNLIRQISSVFRRGVDNATLKPLKIVSRPVDVSGVVEVDTLTAADSLQFINEGMIEAPVNKEPENKRKRTKNRKNGNDHR